MWGRIEPWWLYRFSRGLIYVISCIKHISLVLASRKVQSSLNGLKDLALCVIAYAAHTLCFYDNDYMIDLKEEQSTY